MIGEEIEVKFRSHERLFILSLILNIFVFTFSVRVIKNGNTELERTIYFACQYREYVFLFVKVK